MYPAAPPLPVLSMRSWFKQKTSSGKYQLNFIDILKLLFTLEMDFYCGLSSHLVDLMRLRCTTMTFNETWVNVLNRSLDNNWNDRHLFSK